jgi:DNA-directed RNA polymerase specialized sigma24 family protein
MAARLDPVPEPYRRAVELRAQGCDEQEIAEQLGVDSAAVPLLLRLAEAKLARSADNGQQEPTTLP